MAVGAYQLAEALKGSRAGHTMAWHRASPWWSSSGRLHAARRYRSGFVLGDADLESLFPRSCHALLSHTRPEPMLGVLRRIDAGPLEDTGRPSTVAAHSTSLAC